MRFHVTCQWKDEIETVTVEAEDYDDAYCADFSDLPEHWDDDYEVIDVEIAE